MTRRIFAHSASFTVRPAVWCVCTLALLSFAIWPRSQAAQQATASVSTKRPLTHQDYDNWRSIQGQQLSRDGKWVAYTLMAQDGDGEVVTRNLATNAEYRYGRGWRPPVQPAENPEGPAIPAQTPAGGGRFT